MKAAISSRAFQRMRTSPTFPCVAWSRGCSVLKNHLTPCQRKRDCRSRRVIGLCFHRSKINYRVVRPFRLRGNVRVLFVVAPRTLHA